MWKCCSTNRRWVFHLTSIYSEITEFDIFIDYTNICIKPKDAGPCRALVPRFYFDADEQNCKKFNYGGCKGNENNFKNEKECKDKCENSV